jgi:myo-inositol-1(or 4)-monophosphatase
MNLTHYCAETAKLATEVGQFIWSQRNLVEEKQVEIKDLNSLVSYVDQQAEEKLVEGLTQLLPEAGFIAEEGSGTRNHKGLNWIVDPLDGTTNFLFGIPTFAISIALVEGDTILMGVVYELGQKELFSAVKGGGAFLNGKPIAVSKNTTLNKALLATGFPYYDFSRMDGFLKLLHYFFTHTRGVRRIGSAAIDLAYVACGRFDGFFEYGLNPWDVAAGALLVQEAGGIVTDYEGGQNYLYGSDITAGSSTLHASVLAKIQELMG